MKKSKWKKLYKKAETKKKQEAELKRAVKHHRMNINFIDKHEVNKF